MQDKKQSFLHCFQDFDLLPSVPSLIMGLALNMSLQLWDYRQPKLCNLKHRVTKYRRCIYILWYSVNTKQQLWHWEASCQLILLNSSQVVRPTATITSTDISQQALHCVLSSYTTQIQMHNSRMVILCPAKWLAAFVYYLTSTWL